MSDGGASRYRPVLSDFDRTLADSFPVFLKHMRRAAEHFSLTNTTD